VQAQLIVEVLRPNREDRLQSGTTFRIQWHTQGLGTNIDWSITLYTNGLRLSPQLATVYEGNGNWHADITVPNDSPSSCNYTLNVNDDVSEINVHSDLFCLGPLTSPGTKATSPNPSTCRLMNSPLHAGKRFTTTS
jgi:hypothetical protein